MVVQTGNLLTLTLALPPPPPPLQMVTVRATSVYCALLRAKNSPPVTTVSQLDQMAMARMIQQM